MMAKKEDSEISFGQSINNEEESNRKDNSDSRFSDTFVQTIVDGFNTMDDSFCEHSENIKCAASGPMLDSNCYNTNEAKDTNITQNESDEICEYALSDVEPSDAVYASVIKNRKKPDTLPEKGTSKL